MNDINAYNSLLKMSVFFFNFSIHRVKK